MNTLSKNLPRGIILLSQPEHLRLSHDDMLGALPAEYSGLPREHVEIDVTALTRRAPSPYDVGAAQCALVQSVRERLDPVRERYPDYRIVYFGSASIPLTIQLGFLLATWQQIEIVPHHHARRTWGWATDGKVSARLAEVKWPKYRDRTNGDAIIRVSTSHAVDRQVTLRAVPEPLVEIDISLEHPEEDAFTCLAEMHEVAHAFRKALDILGDDFPGVRCVHLFASVQPGMALLLGAQISSSMHPPVQTYRYGRHAEEGPYHMPAILVNGPNRPPPPQLTDEDVARAHRDREHLREDVKRMTSFALRAQRTVPKNWVADALSLPEGHTAFGATWLHLPPMHKTPLPKTTVDVSMRCIDDSFRLNPENAWQIDDHWLARLAKRIPADDERRRALRQLVLHEAVHRGRQTLTRTSSQEIGRFPKVLEEIDYHADVWAMLYEYALTEIISTSSVDKPEQFFRQLVRLATETMWAFDDDGSDLHRIQIRRLNRYLIWYWQYLRLEQAANGGESMTLERTLAILADKPILELAGPPVMTNAERSFFDLDAGRDYVPELAIYHDGRLHRHGTRVDFPIATLLRGVRNRDGNAILDVLRAAFEQTVRS
ncbi:MAG: SAVED domain-containing protein [Polyangiaceae bacterium]|nr:SAVED domain-containing protein [Polyangiaceae bacterium]